MSEPIVIVGANAAGLATARHLRVIGNDQSIILVDKDREWPYDRPPLSKAVLKSAALRDAPDRLITSDECAALDLELELGRSVSNLDPVARTIGFSDAKRLAFDKLVLATGAQPKKLSCPGGKLEGVHTLRTLSDARQIADALCPDRRLVVVGGGVIGCEVAASATEAGCHVTILETASHLCSRLFPVSIAEQIADRHRQNGVSLVFGAQPSAFIGTDSIEGVQLSDGRFIPADLAVVGVGVTPNIQLAVIAGLAVRNGVVTDAHAQTSHPDIYAVGDVANSYNEFFGAHARLETIQNAIHTGHCAASAITGHDIPDPVVPWGWSDQFNDNIQYLGAWQDADSIVTRTQGPSEIIQLALRGNRIRGAIAINRGKDIAITRRLIASGAPVSIEDLEDTSIGMNAFIKRKAQAQATA